MSTSRKKDPAMPWYGKDFYDDEHVKLMSLEQEGAYSRLLWHAWSHGSIPADLESIAKLFGVPKARAAKIWPAIAPCWTPGADGRLVQKRLEREREDRRVHAEEMRRLANLRWGNGAAPDAGSHAQSHSGNGAKPSARRHPSAQSSASPSASPIAKEGSKEGPLPVLTEGRTVLQIAEDLARAEAGNG